MSIITGSIVIVAPARTAGATNIVGLSRTATTALPIAALAGASGDFNTYTFSPTKTGAFSLSAFGTVVTGFFNVLKYLEATVGGGIALYKFDPETHGDFYAIRTHGVPIAPQLDKSEYNPEWDGTVRSSPEWATYVWTSFAIHKYSGLGVAPASFAINKVNASTAGDFNVVTWDDTPDDPASFRAIDASHNITAVDINPPFFSEQSPSASGVGVNPAGAISFHVKDLSTGVRSTSVDITVHGDNIITNGIVTAASGVATFTEVNFRDYVITYTPDVAFEEHETVTVNGYFQDLATPTNEAWEEYWFRIWATSNLAATLNCLPDPDNPVITLYYPTASASGISASAAIAFLVEDMTTGINYNSLVLSIDGATIFSGGALISTSGTMTATTTASGYLMQYQPNNNWEYLSTHTVNIYVEDNYTPAPNSTTESYTFTVIENTIVIRNFFMPNVGDNQYVESGTAVTVEVVDFTNGISAADTYFKINGSAVTTTLTSIEGGKGYLLSYDPPNDFDYDSIISIEVVAQSNDI